MDLQYIFYVLTAHSFSNFELIQRFVLLFKIEVKFAKPLYPVGVWEACAGCSNVVSKTQKGVGWLVPVRVFVRVLVAFKLPLPIRMQKLIWIATNSCKCH